MKCAASECPHKNAEYGRKRVNREIDPTRMPSGDVKLQNFDYCAEAHRPNAQNPLAPCIRQTKQDAGDQECRGVLDVMWRVGRRSKVWRHHCKHHNGRQGRPRRHQIKLSRHFRCLFAAQAARTMPVMNVTTAANLSHVPGPISIAAVICRNLAALATPHYSPTPAEVPSTPEKRAIEMKKSAEAPSRPRARQAEPRDDD